MAMFKKLRTRIMLLAVVLASLVMLIAFVLIYTITAGRLQVEHQIKLNSLGLLSFSDYVGGDTLPSDYDLTFMLSVNGEGAVLDAYSRCGYPDSEEVFSDAAYFAWQNGSIGTYGYFNTSWRYQIFSDTDEAARIAFVEVSPDQNTLALLLFTLALVFAGMLAVIFLFSRFFAGRVVRPVSEAWERQKRFVADASHELKTPLMAIMANYDVLEANEEETIKSQREWLDAIKVGTDRMGSLVSDLLTLARVEGMALQEEKQSFDLRELMREVMRSMNAAARAKNLQVEVSGLPELEVFGYAASVRQIFAVLYENAVKYTEEDGRISVRLQLQRKRAQILLRNTGMGIAAQDLPHIFERFYRADLARSTDTGSYGLGLSIARGAAARIGGQLTAKSVPGVWTEFIFSFEIK